MTPEPNDHEIKSVLSLPLEDRYLYFLKRIVDFDAVWMAKDEKGTITINHETGEVLLVWPARRYAERAMEKNWPGCEYVSVRVSDWLDKYLRPERDAEDYAIAVFVDSDGNGSFVRIPDLIQDVEQEMSTRLFSQPGYDPEADEVDLMELLKPAMRRSMKAKPKGKLP